VWWYDHEGAVQSHGINFIQDLPYFLVLLLCFQRFTPKDWGIAEEFRFTDRPGLGECFFSFEESPGTLVEINIQGKLHGHYGLRGRSTQIRLASSLSPDPRDATKRLSSLNLVAKIYRPKRSRIPEQEILEQAYQVAKTNDKVAGHLPDLICSRDVRQYSTDKIRCLFRLPSKSSRILRVMVFRRLYPITDLIQEQFLAAFWDCFRCKGLYTIAYIHF
jgi:hypothetical protein